ncbi:hypothetical protein [Domibacillus indicus]|nr:hypothetical protein [Domibacillus indicus]
MENTQHVIIPYNSPSSQNDISYESVQIKDSENKILFDSSQE